MMKTLITLTAAASIAFASVAAAMTNEEYDRYVRQVEHAKRMKELENELLKTRCMTAKLQWRNLDRSRYDSAMLRYIDEQINKCRAEGLW